MKTEATLEPNELQSLEYVSKFVVDNLALDYKKRVIENYIKFKEGGHRDLNSA